jgi:guanylate kinase
MIVIVGGTASGKSTLIDELVDTGQYQRIITTTTRPIREGEINGIDYHFVSEDEFMSLVKNDMFVEWEKLEINGHLYGAQKSSVIETDLIPVIIVEPNGLLTWQEKAKEIGFKVFSVFVYCDIQARIERIVNRTVGTLLGKLVNNETLQDIAQVLYAEIDEHTKRIVSMSSSEIDWFTRAHWDTVIDGNSASGVHQIAAALEYQTSKTYLQ